MGIVSGGSPRILSKTRVQFVYQGAAKRVELVGDLNCWTRGSHRLVEINPEYWTLELDLLPETRCSYRLVVDGIEILDPQNAAVVMTSIGRCSELHLPGAIQAPELESPVTGIRTIHTVSSYHLGGERDVIVHRPDALAPAGGYALILCHDGVAAEDYLELPRIVDNLVTQGVIPPTICVMIPPENRFAEYSTNPEHAAFLVDEVLPMIRAAYPVTESPSQTLIMGTSLGGLAAVHAAFLYPNVFGLAVGLSGAYSLDNESITHQYAAHDRIPVCFYLACGLYENCFIGGPQFGATVDVLTANRNFAATLDQKGYDCHYVECPDSHSWRFWQKQVGPALRWLLA
jgi:enterochelin esterase-like enzyme